MLSVSFIVMPAAGSTTCPDAFQSPCYRASPDPLRSSLAGTQTASGGTSTGASLAAIVSPFAALRMDPLQEGDEASQASPMRTGQPLSAVPQGAAAAPAGFMAAPVGSGEAL